MILNNNINIRRLNIDIHSEINTTNVVLYTETLNEYQLILQLIDNDTYYIIPDTTKLIVKINGYSLPMASYKIADKYRGTVIINLKKDFFMPEGKTLNTSVAQIMTLEMYSETTFGSYQYTITVPLAVVIGTDDGEQNSDTQLGPGAGTTVPSPDVPSPQWNLTQGIEPPIPPSEDDTPDDDADNEVDHIIFDGGSFF